MQTLTRYTPCETWKQLYRAIVANPTETTTKLAFADFLDEEGCPSNAARARFIREQIELDAMGPERKGFHGKVIPRGPGYYEIVGVDDYEFRVGDRVDCAWFSRNLKKKRNWYGLLVVKIMAGDGNSNASMKEDHLSVPFPEKRHTELIRSTELAARENGHHWWDESYSTVSPWYSHDGQGITLYELPGVLPDFLISLKYHHGFLSRVSCSWDVWEKYGETLVKELPITNVELLVTSEPRDS